MIKYTPYPVIPKLEDVLDNSQLNHITMYGMRVAMDKWAKTLVDDSGSQNKEQDIWFCSDTMLRRQSAPKSQDKERNAKVCGRGCGACLNLFQGRMARCSAVFAFPYYQERFNTPMPRPVDNSISIHSADSWSEVLNFMDIVPDACRYCILPYPTTEWNISKGEKSEWNQTTAELSAND
jgi:hypothetical protein